MPLILLTPFRELGRDSLRDTPGSAQVRVFSRRDLAEDYRGEIPYATRAKK